MEPEPVARLVAARVRHLRRERGWSAERLAKACDEAGYKALTRSTIAKIESGVRKTITATEVAGLAKALDITPTQLLAPEFVDQPDAALRIWPAEEREQLFELLDSGQWVRLAADYRAAAGPYAPEPEFGRAGPQTYFQELERLNSPANGIPPSLVFLERLAAQVESGLAEELRAWIRRQTTRLDVSIPALNEPVGAAAREGAHLMIRLERDVMDGDHYQMRHWTQLGDSPRPGREFDGTLHSIQRHVAELIAEAEADWAADAAFIRLEFMLPRELLNLPVDQWPGEVAGEPPQPLGLRHQIVVRSLERMKAKHWHRLWRHRWQVLRDMDSLLAPDSVVWSDAPEPVELRRLDASLAARNQVMMVLPHRPQVRPDAAGDEVVVGLRAGLPVMLWLRDDRFSEGFEAVVNTLLDAGRDLPESTRLLRGKAFSADDPETHVGSHVTLLWDDPNRLVELSSPFGA